MLNKEGQRELCYIVNIDNIEPIIGSDNCEAAIVGGWKIMVRKNTFKKGDMAIYFEIDSKVPETKEFEFLLKKHYKIKTQKYTFGGKGNFISQGLLMSLTDFPDIFEEDHVSNMGWLYTAKAKQLGNLVKPGDFLTQYLGVTYSVAEDNKRKGKSSNKYQKMYQRHIKLFRKFKILQKIYDTKYGKKILFLFLGSKKDNRGWPEWVRKTDEERCQNLPQLFPGDDTKWIVTEKIDGTSTTFTYKKRGKNKGFYVCSRNVCFDRPEKEDKCFYDTNVYLEMAKKYNIEEILKEILNEYPEYDFITLQGETYGEGVQKRTYGLSGHDFMAFNLIIGNDINDQKRIDTITMTDILKEYKIPSVPILETNFKIPTTCDELLTYADGKSQIDGETREGVVLRTWDGINSFKAVSNEFLLKYKE
ncbi:MAG: RNA ligase family protein [Bacilli bacterium]